MVITTCSQSRSICHDPTGNDWIKTHWGRGVVDCGSGRDVLYISRRAQRSYKIRHCERISHKTLGY